MSFQNLVPWMICCLFGTSILAESMDQIILTGSKSHILSNNASSKIISGLYDDPPRIVISDINGEIEWECKWNKNESKNNDLGDNLKYCMGDNSSNSATDVKFARNGTMVAAFYSKAAVVINHMPGNKENDKIVYAVCTNQTLLWNAHTLKVLPGDLLAVATTGQTQEDGFVVYNMSSPSSGYDKPLRQLKNLPAIHGLIWDKKGNMLWTGGTNTSANGGPNHPAYVVLQGYPFDAGTGLLREDRLYRYQLPTPHDLDTEWSWKNRDWWEGAHDLVPIPDDCKLLMTTDRDVYCFDIETGIFLGGLAVQEIYFEGFQPLGCRTGINRDGQEEWLPRSDI